MVTVDAWRCSSGAAPQTVVYVLACCRTGPLGLAIAQIARRKGAGLVDAAAENLTPRSIFRGGDLVAYSAERLFADRNAPDCCGARMSGGLARSAPPTRSAGR